MADDISKKISIDVELNNNGQQQVDQLQSSFTDLRTTINSLDKDLSRVNGTLNDLNSKNLSTSTSGSKLKNTFSDLAGVFKIGYEAISTFKKGIQLFEASLSGGLSILIVFGPEILKWATALIKGKEAITQAKLSLDTLNGALQSSAYSDAIKQVNEFKINIGLAKQGVLDKQEVLKQYNDTLGKTMGKTNDLNKVEAILVNKGGEYIKMTLLKAEAELALQDAAKKAYEAEQVKIKPDDDVLTFWDKTVDTLKRVVGAGLTAQGAIDAWTQADIDKTIKAEQRRKEAITDANNQKNSFLAIATNFEKQAAEIAKESGFDFFSGTITSPGTRKNKNPILQPTPLQPPTRAIDKSSPQKQNDNDPSLSTDDQAALSATAISDAQKTSDALKQIESQRLHDMMVQHDADLKAKAAKDKQAAEQLKDFELKMAQNVSSAAFSILSNSIKQQSDAKIAGLEKDEANALRNTSLTSAQRLAIKQKYKQQEDQVKTKAFKAEQEASIAQAVINGALAVTKATSQTGVLSPFVVPEIIAETAIEIAKIASQKPPAYAAGGLHYASDGRGGMLPGYSLADNTNAYLRSGEGIVVSEAMREPWARNLVSAINVGFGGRDFATTATGRGFAVGGVFTDGGNANRYYNAPVNDQKNLANTIAYQMINNFPPVYVDVKDINNQQNILAQTINRVNL